MSTKLLYFGCIDQSGHYLWGDPQRRSFDFSDTPWDTQVDGGLCMQGGQPQGQAVLHQKDGWTAIAFWDRSVDSRPGSNSAFLADKLLSFDEIVALSKERFPAVWKRFPFAVAQLEPSHD
jgi:hypothetical protein